MKTSNSRVTVIGSINTDMVVKAERLPAPGQTVSGGEFFMNAGGKGGNQAVAAARLDAEVAMVANIGRDMFGDAGIQRLQQEGVGCDFVCRDDDQASGVALISVDEQGENHIVVAPGANDALTEGHIEQAFDSIPEASLVLMQLEIPLPSVARAILLAHEKGCRVILDPAPAVALPDEMLRGLYLLTPNESEAEILTGIAVNDETTAREAATALLGRGADRVAITLGKRGVYLAHEGRGELIPAVPVDAVDTTAAGDCFNGALAASLARGNELHEAAALACRAAAIAVTRRGAQDAMPHAHELEH